MGPPITRSMSLRPISATESYRLTTTVTRSLPYRWRSAAAMRLAPRTVDSSWFATTTIVVDQLERVEHRRIRARHVEHDAAGSGGRRSR